MYSYSAEFLETFSSLPPGRLEQLEKLEQLRVLENGYPIAVGITSDLSIGIDTLEDAKLFEALL
jgi:3-deoxy-manno-octulosonate cytidylyltransferase (CMP-KDO synthetase)